ncbi:restriction endonuclease subunit S [Streptomyces sp. P38-E01]|uniref:Restriction endonuclease subunit S n=1 Tax=Streptomyces tardus TaxID=2780544 RepID=A0A949JJ48_9ACTN|nr:restriction endonuclease subunit S [Streptomyces tardus]MBU7597189.1 restriction endonuclease subunit S [Streptomyces tardus]
MNSARIDQSILSSVAWPSGWRTVPLWAMFDRIKDVGHPYEELLSVYRDYGVVKRESRDDNFNKAAPDRNIYQLIGPGWLVVNRMKAWQGSVGISKYRGIVSGHYICFRPNHREEGRFLNWLLRSGIYATEFASLSRGVRPGQVEIDNDLLRVLPVKIPPVGEQRRIADFLDAEIGYIDALLDARKRQLDRLKELWTSSLAARVESMIAEHGIVRLRRVVRSVEQGWSPQCEDAPAGPDEWAVLKTSSVSSGVFRPMEHKRLPGGLHPDLRYRILDGDLLMTRGSGSTEHVGVSTVANTEGRNLLLSDLLYRIRTDREWSPEFVALMLRSRPVRGFMSLLMRGQSGQTIKLRSEDIKEIHVPSVPVEQQVRITADLTAEERRIEATRAAIETSSALLSESRQALITAAVTGQLDVTTARPTHDRNL